MASPADHAAIKSRAERNCTSAALSATGATWVGATSPERDGRTILDAVPQASQIAAIIKS